MMVLRTAAAAAAAFVLAYGFSHQAMATASAEGDEAKISESIEEVEAFEFKVVEPTREAELHCLATAIYHEARGEPERGQLVVGGVILNRVASRFYPDTICQVVYQNVHMRNACQFSFACDGITKRVTENEVWKEIRQRAEWLMNCQGDIDCQESKRNWAVWASTHYHADYVHPFWADKIMRTGQIGRHIFYYTATM